LRLINAYSESISRLANLKALPVPYSPPHQIEKTCTSRPPSLARTRSRLPIVCRLERSTLVISSLDKASLCVSTRIALKCIFLASCAFVFKISSSGSSSSSFFILEIRFFKHHHEHRRRIAVVYSN